MIWTLIQKTGTAVIFSLIHFVANEKNVAWNPLEGKPCVLSQQLHFQGTTPVSSRLICAQIKWHFVFEVKILSLKKSKHEDITEIL